ncbi:MAG: N-acetyltransferase [Cryomorphaceae bacterium]|nr:MAG: N-acetyltransferase [Cryomorphaceae bacterium]
MIQTERLILRALEPADVHALYRWENDVENWLVSHTTKPFSQASLEQFILNITDIYSDKQLRLMISLNDDDSTIGAIDLFECDFTHLRAGVGILIGEKESRGMGYGKEALDGLATYAREVLFLQQLYADVLANNVAAQRLFDAAGYEQTGIRKNWIRTSGGWQDLILMTKKLHGEKE